MKRIVFIAFLFFTTFSFGQDTSITKAPYEHIVKRATIWSAIIPGAGQIYNEVGYRKYANKKHRAWWKVPLIYGGLGATGYFYYINNKESNLLKEEILFRREHGYNLHSQYDNATSEDNLIDGQFYNTDGTLNGGFDEYSKNRDLFIFAFIGVWAIQTIEAMIDAHFVSFDVSPDLTFNWTPTMMDFNTPGISLNLNFN